VSAKRAVRVLFGAFLVLYALAVTYPGLLLVNHVRPFVFGMPFLFFWFALWIVLAFIVLVITDVVESREEE
jgi:hypothetical protein